MRSLMGENRLNDLNLKAPLKWRREKENVARELYFRLLRRQHRCLAVKESGLLINDEYPVLRCSLMANAPVNAFFLTRLNSLK